MKPAWPVACCNWWKTLQGANSFPVWCRCGWKPGNWPVWTHRRCGFALDSLAPGTLLEGADIQIEEPPGQAWCLTCAQTVPIAQRGDDCPLCGGFQLQPTGGQELRVLDMMVSDD
jgi:Zn finger protein HypA/HybF involved in hydrogenase expression